MAKVAEKKKRPKLRHFQLRQGVAPHYEPNPEYDPDKRGAEEDNPRDIEILPGDIVQSKRELDRIFVNKFDRVRPGEEEEEETPNAPGGDVPVNVKKDPNKDRPVRSVLHADVNSADRFLEEEELEGKPEAKKLAKGKSFDEEEESVQEESDFGEDVTDDFDKAEDAGVKVFKDDEGKHRVFAEDDLDTPLDGAKKGFTKKVNVNAFIKKHAAKQRAAEEEEE